MTEQRCHIRRMALKFLQMKETEMHYVAMLLKDQPYANEAYEMAKKMRLEQRGKK